MQYDFSDSIVNFAFVIAGWVLIIFKPPKLPN